jgi:hypothetical protein
MESKSYDWLKYATKPLLIDTLLKKHWTSKNKTELQRLPLDELKHKIQYIFNHHAKCKDIQQFEERVYTEKQRKEMKREERLDTNKKHKHACLYYGNIHFQPGKSVWIFDEHPKYKKLIPIPAKIIQRKNEGKHLVVEFQVNRPWYEAGGHWIYKGQQMTFHFDPITCKWLREGLTPEVIRSYGKDGKSRYFELTYTRQYIMTPSNY